MTLNDPVRAPMPGDPTDPVDWPTITGAQAAQDVASEATSEPKAVAGHAKDQLGDFVGQARDEVRRQADDRSAQAATGLRSLADQVGALKEGRTEEAGNLAGYLDEAQAKVSSFAARVEEGGAQGVLDDLTSLARRRPGVFLAGAAVAGFAAGRFLRAARSDDGGQSSVAATTGAPSAMAPPLPPPDATGDLATGTAQWTDESTSQVPTSASVGGGRTEL